MQGETPEPHYEAATDWSMERMRTELFNFIQHEGRKPEEQETNPQRRAIYKLLTAAYEAAQVNDSFAAPHVQAAKENIEHALTDLHSLRGSRDADLNENGQFEFRGSQAAAVNELKRLQAWIQPDARPGSEKAAESEGAKSDIENIYKRYPALRPKPEARN